MTHYIGRIILGLYIFSTPAESRVAETDKPKIQDHKDLKPSRGKQQTQKGSKDLSFYKAEVAKTFKECVNRIRSIERQDSLWKTKGLKSSQKRKMKKLDTRVSFSKYLDIINDLKIYKRGQEGKFRRLLKNWDDLSEKGIKKLGANLTQDLRLFAGSCKNPVDFVQNHIEERKKVIGK